MKEKPYSDSPNYLSVDDSTLVADTSRNPQPAPP